MLSDTFFSLIMNWAKKRYSGSVANLPLWCSSLALKYLVTDDNLICCSMVWPNLPFGNNTGNASSSHSFSVITDTGCLFSPGAIW